MPKPINACWMQRLALAQRRVSVRDWRSPEQEKSGWRASFLKSSNCGMVYAVNITLRAERDLEHLYGEIDAAESDAARKWYEGLKRQILSLEELPNRCPVTPEKKNMTAPPLPPQTVRLSGNLPRHRKKEAG